MNSSNYRFTLNMHTAQSQVSIPVMLGDTGRTLRINLSDGGNPYIIADGCLAKITIKRPTGTRLEDFCTIEGNTTIVYPFSENTCATEGIHDCDVTLYGLDGNIITSPRFSMVVSDRVIRADDIVVTDKDLTAVDAMVAEEAVRQANENARLANESAREISEYERIASEEARVLAEASRASAETSRSAAEEQRGSNEEARDANEAERISKDANRDAAINRAVEASAEALSKANDATTEVGVFRTEHNEMKSLISLNDNRITTLGAVVDWNAEHISRNGDRIAITEKRVTNLEKGVAADNFVTDDSVAYAKSVPANAAPYAAISKVGGMTHRVNVGTEEAPVYELRHAEVTGLKTTGKNIFGGEAFADKLVSVAKGTKNEEDGTVYVGGAQIAGDVVLENVFKENTPYTIILKCLSAASGYVSIMVAYTDGTHENITGLSAGVTTTIVKVTNANKTVKNLVGTNRTNDTFYYNECGIFEGVLTAEDFEPYVEHLAMTIPEAVRPANGINENVYDFIAWEESGVRTVTKRVGVVEDMGKLSLVFHADYVNSNRDYKPSAKTLVVLPPAFTKGYIDANGAIVIIYPSGTFASVQEVKDALSGVKFYYELATPEVTDISDILPEDNLIEVEGGGTITFENEHGLAVPSEVIYQTKGAAV